MCLPIGYARGAVLAEAQLACRCTRLSSVQNESWFTPPLSQTGRIPSFQFGWGYGRSQGLRDRCSQGIARLAFVIVIVTFIILLFIWVFVFEEVEEGRTLDYNIDFLSLPLFLFLLSCWVTVWLPLYFS